jgi:hypothetical protein
MKSNIANEKYKEFEKMNSLLLNFDFEDGSD